MNVLCLRIGIIELFVYDKSFKFLLISECYYARNDSSGFSETSRSLICHVETQIFSNFKGVLVSRYINHPPVLARHFPKCFFPRVEQVGLTPLKITTILKFDLQSITPILIWSTLLKPRLVVLIGSTPL